jgi:hypothetical protein
MKTVLRGELPALAVAHTDDGLWLVADGVHHPDNADASQFVHLAHLVERDPTLRELADLPSSPRTEKAPHTRDPARRPGSGGTQPGKGQRSVPPVLDSPRLSTSVKGASRRYAMAYGHP